MSSLYTSPKPSLLLSGSPVSSHPLAESFSLSGLFFHVTRSAKRKTLDIVIERDGTLCVSAPVGVGLETIEALVTRRLPLLYTKLEKQAALQKPIPTKEYVNGEGFYYLGRSYRLLLVEEQDKPLKLMGGRFRMLHSALKSPSNLENNHRPPRKAQTPFLLNPNNKEEKENTQAQGKKLFVAWYKEHATVWLTRQATRWSPRLAAKPKAVQLCDLGYRWGSCNPDGTLQFHWQTILLPPNIVEYVLVHEMVHLHEPNHGKAFWQRLARAMPDYEERKEWLAVNGMRYGL
ncbi:M48 family metallopeptidase [Myxococcota bacterium]|nr:M48 family metallopeptidase [Myxococcota bacterium]